MKMVRILVDCFGGDHSPEANVEGAVKALGNFKDLEVILTGDEEILKKQLEGKDYDTARLSIVHAPEVIEVGEKPTDAIRLKKESSMMKAVRMLRDDDEMAGMVSTGSTGALVAAALTRLGHKSLGSAPAASSGATGPSLPRSHLAKPPFCLYAARLLPSGPLRASHTLIFFPFSIIDNNMIIYLMLSNISVTRICL